MLQLADLRVRSELRLSAETEQKLTSAVEEFQQRRRMLATQLVGGLAADNPELSDLLSEFDTLITSQLTDWQNDRLRQIHRQRWLPFTFKTREIIESLQLSRTQLRDIGRVIEETRPNRGGLPGDVSGGLPELAFSPGGPPESFDVRPVGVPPKPAFMYPPRGVERTVREVLKLLSDKQRSRWDELIGPPFAFR